MEMEAPSDGLLALSISERAKSTTTYQYVSTYWAGMVHLRWTLLRRELGSIGFSSPSKETLRLLIWFAVPSSHATWQRQGLWTIPGLYHWYCRRLGRRWGTCGLGQGWRSNFPSLWNLPGLVYATINDFWICGLKTSLLSLTISHTCPGMFFLAIFKRLLMIKMAISICCFTFRHGPSLAWNGMAFILYFALSRLDGRRVLIYITISVLPLRVQHVCLGFQCLST